MPVTIDATVSGATANSYAIQSVVNTHMDSVPWFRSIWDAYLTDVKDERMSAATRAIDRLKYKGVIAVTTQSLEFPRRVKGEGDPLLVVLTVIPPEVLRAFYLMIEYQARIIDDTSGVASDKFSRVRIEGVVDLTYASGDTKRSDDEKVIIGAGNWASIRAELSPWLGAQNAIAWSK